MEILAKKLLFRKEWLNRGVLAAVIALVGIGSFGLGRLSALEESREVLMTQTPARAIPLPTAAAVTSIKPTAEAAVASVSHTFFASQNGTRYYPAGCAGGSRITDANKYGFLRGGVQKPPATGLRLIAPFD